MQYFLEHLTEIPYLHFTKTPREIETITNEDLVLKCEAIGIPPPIIEWAYNGKLMYAVDESNDVEKVYNAGLRTIQNGVTASKIVIPCTSTKTVTQYKCLANNQHYKLETITTITNEGSTNCSHKLSSPVINMWTDGRFERSGATVQLFCRIHDNLKSNITWYNEASVKLENAKKYKIMKNGDLIIHDTVWEDMGVYTCVASNEFGEDRIMAFFYPTQP
ncbi:unnamed protein product [Thelazia callipaeda]|uniref:Ig-like domain-containing protein n=1 Tax=Thelazia callipaeda TaxID=103827 RepID=A0A0N5CP26_THECL|nr:unnamed protein product [Thelazia callipaeda]